MVDYSMMAQVGYEKRRVFTIHEDGPKDAFPSRTSGEGLRVTEICLADGATSKVA